MSGFELDTSGVVPAVGPTSPRTPYWPERKWSDLTPFCQGFIRAMFESLPWSNVYCDDCPPDGYPTDKTRCSECPRLHRFDIISPSALERIMRDCRHDQEVGFRIGSGEDRSSAKAGRLFWKERQSGSLFDCPPLTVSLDDAGRVTLQERS